MSVSKEMWKPVQGYENLYEVSNLGRVRKKVWQEIKGGDFNGGYRRLCLHKDGKQKSVFVHRLVAEAFIPNPNGYPIINHKDECPSNNHVDNLEWCDQKHNMNWGTVNERKAQNSSNRKPVMSIDKETGERTYYRSIADATKAMTGKHTYSGSISEVVSGKRKSAYGKYWFYVAKDGVEDVCK